MSAVNETTQLSNKELQSVRLISREARKNQRKRQKNESHDIRGMSTSDWLVVEIELNNPNEPVGQE